MHTRNILITGITGLLGQGLLGSIPAGDRVIGVSRGLTTGVVNDSLELVQTDVTDQEAIDRIFDRYEIDVVIHAAGEGSVDVVEKDPILGRLSIVQGAENLASISKKHDANLGAIIGVEREVGKVRYRGSSHLCGSFLWFEQSRIMDIQTMVHAYNLTNQLRR